MNQCNQKPGIFLNRPSKLVNTVNNNFAKCFQLCLFESIAAIRNARRTTLKQQQKKQKDIVE